MEKRSLLTWLLVLLVLGGFLRLYHLDGMSLENDELSSWNRSSYPTLHETMEKGIIPDVHPPGFQVPLFYWMRWFGDSVATLRFPSAIAGILTIPLLFLLALRMFNSRVAIVSTALLSVSWAPVFFSQTARAYIFLILFVLLSMYAWYGFFRALREKHKPTTRDTVLLAVANIILPWLHYYGVLFIFLQGVTSSLFFLRQPKALVRLLSIYLLSLIVYIPWLPIMFYHMGLSSYITSPSVLAPLMMLGYFFNKSTIVLMAALLLIVVGYWSFARDRSLFPSLKKLKRLPEADIILIVWLFLPVGIAMVQSWVFTPVLNWRNLLISMPAAYLLVAVSIDHIRLSIKGRFIIAGVFVTFVLVNLVWMQGYYWKPAKAQFREIAAYVIDHQDPRGAHLICANTFSSRYFEYYFEKMGSPLRVDLSLQDSTTTETAIEVLRTLEFDSARTDVNLWLLRAVKKPDSTFTAVLHETGWDSVYHQEFEDGELWQYRMEVPQPGK